MRAKPKSKMLQRARWHDYRSRCIYMITMSKAPGVPELSHVVNVGSTEKAKATVKLTPTGQTVAKQIEAWSQKYPELKICTKCIMPDHVHILLFVTGRTHYPLGTMVKDLKWNLNGIFDIGFNDKIVTKPGQREAFYRYILDNPRRYLARKLYPEYFTRVNSFLLNGKKVSLYGNLFLLNHPIKTVVRFSRRFTPEQLRKNKDAYEETIRSCGVLVSPFIHKEEKAVKEEAIEASTPVIQVALNGFPERYKPSGRDFELCAQGKLLIVAPIEYSTQKQPLQHEAAIQANAIAEAIASLPTNAI